MHRMYLGSISGRKISSGPSYGIRCTKLCLCGFVPFPFPRKVGFGMFTCMLQMCEQSHASVDQLLTALWHAEYHGRYNLYRTAIILLADVGLEFGMTKWCKRLMDEVMPQVCLNARGFVSACLFVPAHDPFVLNYQYRYRPDHE